MWRPSGVTPVQPPIKRKPSTRLKKKRAREPNELTSRKVGIFKQCKACGKLWHNSYRGEIGGNSALPGTTNRTSTFNKVIVWANFALCSNCVRGRARPNIPCERRRTSEDIQPRNGQNYHPRRGGAYL